MIIVSLSSRKGDGFLADVKVAKAADQAHPIELTHPLIEAPDQQHRGVIVK
jgi:hypothetical protein